MLPLLSIIVISHEQREELKRCLESIFAMNIPFEYEVIVSDDRSMDGTREMLEKEYANRVVITYCNSDEGHCANNSQRSGYNRCNAYPLAKGKYIAHVDADDYFRTGAKVYERQVAALEAHPECALAMSTCVWKTADKTVDECGVWLCKKTLQDEEIITAEEFIQEDYFRINQCFMQRRQPNVNPVMLYGKRYVDSVITYHHLQFGPIVYVDSLDYVYVQSPHSIAATTASNEIDLKIMWCLAIYISVLIPRWWRYFMQSEHYYWSVRDVLDLALANVKMTPEKYFTLGDLPAWIYGCFNRDIHLVDRIRISCAIETMKLYKKKPLQNKIYAWITRKLIIG